VQDGQALHYDVEDGLKDDADHQLCDCSNQNHAEEDEPPLCAQEKGRNVGHRVGCNNGVGVGRLTWSEAHGRHFNTFELSGPDPTLVL